MKSNRNSKYSFELLNYVWLEGYCTYILDANDQSYRFHSIEEALLELQEDFDTWASEIRRGEREDGYEPEEFMIRCTETGALCGVQMIKERLYLMSLDTAKIVQSTDYHRINSTGSFGDLLWGMNE